MQSRKDAALRKIVEDERLPMKTRRDALAEMEAPSRAFLVRLANDPGTPAKLRLDASRWLPDAERRIADERAARARPQRSEEGKRREIDEVLRLAAQELGIALDGGGSKSNPESVELVIVEPQPVAPNVPLDGALSVADRHTQSEQPMVRKTDTPDTPSDPRRDLLAQGRALASAILAQLGVMAHAPVNWHAGAKKLEQLQAEFMAWERTTQIDHPEIDTQKEFPDARLRSVQKVVDLRGYMVQRQVLTIDEQNFIAEPAERAKAKAAQVDSGMWGGIPGGI